MGVSDLRRYIETLDRLDANPREPQIRAGKSFGGRVLERAGVPTTAEGWKEHYIRGPLGALLSPLFALGESVDTGAEALGKPRPVSPEWRTPGGSLSIGLGDMAEQAVGALPLGPVLRGAKALVGERATVGPLMRSLPESTTGIPQGPVLPPQGPIPRSRPRPLDLAQQDDAARAAGFGPRKRPFNPEGRPQEVSAYRDLTSEGTLLDAEGRSVVAPPPSPLGREELRGLYKGRREPRIDLEGRAPDVGPAEPDLPLSSPPDFTVTERPKAQVNRLTLPKRPTRPDPPPPLDLPPPDPQGPVLGAHGRPVTAQEATMPERERLRALYRGRLDDPPRPPDVAGGRPSVDPSVFGLDLAPSGPLPAPAVTPNPQLALRDYTAPGGTRVTLQIGDELVTLVKSGRNEWQGRIGGFNRKLTGESALHWAARGGQP